MDGLTRFLEAGSAPVPTRGYQEKAADEDRTLFTYDVGGRAKVAVIVARTSDEERDSGWGTETYALWDPAEFAPENDNELKLQVWTGSDGERAPVTDIMSQPGDAHCAWEDVTFLVLEQEHQYVRDPGGASANSNSLAATYAANAERPADASDTRYRLGDQELWLAADKSSAYVVGPDGGERWPATDGSIACM